MASRLLSSAISPRMFLLSASLSSSAAGRRSQFLQCSSVLSQTLLKPAAISVSIPGVLSDIWESVLRAVPKKKTSHMKKRHRQMAGKALKDVKNMTKCPGCGEPKRAHVLCPHCVEDIKNLWKTKKTA